MDSEKISVVKVRDILLVTIPRELSDRMLTEFQENVLNSMERFNSRAVILDISAVDTVDSFFARTVAETAKMVAVMGGLTVVAGMSPSVAITATQLGITFEGIKTALNVDLALDLMQQRA